MSSHIHDLLQTRVWFILNFYALRDYSHQKINFFMILKKAPS